MNEQVNDLDVLVTVVCATVALVVVVGLVVALLIINTNRRHRHLAELADLRVRHVQEVMRSEREATQQTLREIGAELHDNVGQVLTVAQMGLRAMHDKPFPDPRLLAAGEAVDRSIEEVRRLGQTLNSDLWRHRTLAEAIDAEAARIERVARVRTLVHVIGDLPALEPDTITVLYRVFQEVVNNALKHSGADTLTVTLGGEPYFTLSVADNGAGFHASDAAKGSGLLNIQRRCALIGFTATCTTSPGAGCTWQFQHTAAHGV
jgi:signal transduction histidine kinase